MILKSIFLPLLFSASLFVHISIVHCANAQVVPESSESTDNSANVRITLAQIPVTTDVDQNLKQFRLAFETAKRDKADWVMFPEGALSGYTPKIDQAKVADGFEQVKQLCIENSMVAIVGTSWKEEGKVYNQLRVVGRNGTLVSTYSKTCLCYNENFEPGTSLGICELDGVRVGMLICNDLWVTPGYTDGPNPHLTKRLAEKNVDIILHAVNSGLDQRFRGYHEENLKVRSAEAKLPFVVVNAAKDKPVNCTSGVVMPFEYSESVPREGVQIKTVSVDIPEN